jgi:hypothetical protein
VKQNGEILPGKVLPGEFFLDAAEPEIIIHEFDG